MPQPHQIPAPNKTNKRTRTLNTHSSPGDLCLGRGEVLIKGESLSSGYYCEEALTKKEFDKDGWFHTGDVAIWTR